MQILIHKTSLLRLEVNLRRDAIYLGDPMQLLQEGSDDVAAFVKLPSRLPFGIGKARKVRAGYLGNNAKKLIMPALAKGGQLRVRIVEIQARHLNSEGIDLISISVWGDPADIIPTDPLGRISTISASTILSYSPIATTISMASRISGTKPSGICENSMVRSKINLVHI